MCLPACAVVSVPDVIAREKETAAAALKDTISGTSADLNVVVFVVVAVRISRARAHVDSLVSRQVVVDVEQSQMLRRSVASCYPSVTT